MNHKNERIKKLWNENKLHDAAKIARHLGLSGHDGINRVVEGLVWLDGNQELTPTLEVVQFETRIVQAAHEAYERVDPDLWNGRAPEDDEFVDVIRDYIHNLEPEVISKADLERFTKLDEQIKRRLILEGM